MFSARLAKAKEQKMIKAICVDLDGMFFTAESFQMFKEKLAPNVEKEKRDFVFALSPQMKTFKTGEITEEEYWNWVRQELGCVYFFLGGVNDKARQKDFGSISRKGGM